MYKRQIQIVTILLLLVITSSCVMARSAKEWNQRGMDLYEQGKYEEAIKCHKKALEIDPKSADLWLNLANDYYHMKNYEKALSSYNEALKYKPKMEKALYFKAYVLYDTGKYEASIKAWDKYLKIYPKSAGAWYNKGVALYDLGKYKEAIKCYDKAIQIAPDYFSPWYNKGVALYDLGKYEEAIKCYDKATQIAPDYVAAWYNKGLTLCNLGKYEKAIKCFDKALEIDPDDGDAKTAREAAVKCYEEATQTITNNAEVQIFSNSNIGAVGNGPVMQTEFTIDKSYKITSIMNYHWNYGEGATPGTIKLVDENGRVYGPWNTTGLDGQGGRKNCTWQAKPNITIPAGTYLVIDSDPDTWSCNEESGNAGFTIVNGCQ